MESQFRVAVIAGSTGLVGAELLTMLLESEKYDKVYSLVRKPTGKQNPKLTELLVDFDELKNSLSSITVVNDVYCCLGTTMKVARSKEAFRKVEFLYPLFLAEWAVEKKANQFLMISAMGANPKSSIYYNRIKGEIENEISALPISSIAFFRPSLLFGYRKEKRIGEKIAVTIFKALSFLFVGLLKNYKGIEASQVAKAMIERAFKQKTGKEIILSGQML